MEHHSKQTLAGRRDGNGDAGFTIAPVGGRSTNRKAARRPAARDRKLSVPCPAPQQCNAAARSERMKRCAHVDSSDREATLTSRLKHDAWHKLRTGVSRFIYARGPFQVFPGSKAPRQTCSCRPWRDIGDCSFPCISTSHLIYSESDDANHYTCALGII